jgi:hypothetical protein
VTVTYDIEQTDKGILVGATAMVKGSPSVIVLIPTSELVMHCICPALDDIARGSIQLTNNYEIGSSAIHTCDGMFELDGPEIRVCQSDGTWNKTEPKCKPTKEAMCNSLNVIANQSLQLEGVTGSCDLSDDCTTTECSLRVALGQKQTSVETSVTYDPCSTPYSFQAYINMPGVGVMINETVTHSRNITIGGTNQIRLTTMQKSYGLIIEVTASFFGREFTITPMSTVLMHCEAER